MISHSKITNQALHPLLKSGEILFGGNSQLKIYGTLTCKSGKRLSKSNRVFFATEQEAIELGYRPCGHCMRKEYLLWKVSNIQFK